MVTLITRRVSLVLLVLIAGLMGGVSVWAGPDGQTGTATPVSAVNALVVVERAVVFPEPDRNTEALTYLYERETVPVFAQNGDGTFLLVRVGTLYGWVLRVQVDLEGDAALLPVTESTDSPGVIASLTFTPFPTVTTASLLVKTPTPAGSTSTEAPVATDIPAIVLTLTPVPTEIILPVEGTPTEISPDAAGTPSAEDEMVVLPGVAPPIAITLPETWEAVDLVVPMLNFDDEVRDIPLTVYFGALDHDVYGLIYLYWGFPNTVDWATGEYNLWADGVQILRGSLVGQSCNLGVYDQQMFTVGTLEGVGANYQASECTDENDTAGWFATLRANGLTFAFFTAVEPWTALGDYGPALQAILDTVEFVDSEETSP